MKDGVDRQRVVIRQLSATPSARTAIESSRPAEPPQSPLSTTVNEAGRLPPETSPASPPVMADAPGGAARTVSLFRYAPGVLLLVIVIAGAGNRADPDLWGHLRFGQAILTQRHIVLNDVYSYSAPGHPFLNHEWLTDVVMALLYDHLGVAGLKLWKFGCAAATILLIAMGLADTGATPSVRLNTLVTAALALMPQMMFRPQVFTFCLFAAILVLLGRHNYRGTAPLWMAVPLVAVWANLHGGFILGIAALGVYAGVVGAQDLIGGAGIARAARLGILTIAATAASLLTPYGIGLWKAVIHALGNPLTRNIVTDWQPLLFALERQWSAEHLGVVYYLCVLGLIAAMVITFVITPRGGDLPLVAIAVLMSAAAFTAVRNMPIAVIACAAPVARHTWLIFTGMRERDARAAAQSPPSDHSGVNQWLAAVLAAVVAITSGLFSTRIMMEPGYPGGALSFMRRHALRGNLLGAFGWGDYLIWHMAPGSKVFIDGRYDTVFPLQVIRDYAVFYFDLPGAAQVLSAYPHDFVLIPPRSPVYRRLEQDPDWKLVYQDQNAVLFARANSAAAKIPDVPVEVIAPERSYFPG